MLEIGGIQPISTVDFPGKVASVIFLCGCPFRCPFCQNAPLVRKEGCSEWSIREILVEIKKNWAITGICFTGGEPLSQADRLAEAIEIIHAEGLDVKFDTNGFYPDRTAQIGCRVEYVAIDVKAPLEKYGKAIGRKRLAGKAVAHLKRSLQNLARSGTKFEIRTTIVPGLNDTEDDVAKICEFVRPYIGGNLYVLQQFRGNMGTLHPAYESLSSPSIKTMRALKQIAEDRLPKVSVRGVGINGET